MAQIVATPGAGDWFKGGLVAYDKEVKSELLGVKPGPVVTSAAAQQMARSVRELLGADLGIATTGEAGPDPEEDVPVGTLFVGVADRKSVRVHHIVLSGIRMRFAPQPRSWPCFICVVGRVSTSGCVPANCQANRSWRGSKRLRAHRQARGGA